MKKGLHENKENEHVWLRDLLKFSKGKQKLWIIGGGSGGVSHDRPLQFVMNLTGTFYGIVSIFRWLLISIHWLQHLHKINLHSLPKQVKVMNVIQRDAQKFLGVLFLDDTFFVYVRFYYLYIYIYTLAGKT